MTKPFQQLPFRDKLLYCAQLKSLSRLEANLYLVRTKLTPTLIAGFVDRWLRALEIPGSVPELMVQEAINRLPLQLKRHPKHAFLGMLLAYMVNHWHEPAGRYSTVAFIEHMEIGDLGLTCSNLEYYLQLFKANYSIGLLNPIETAQPYLKERPASFLKRLEAHGLVLECPSGYKYSTHFTRRGLQYHLKYEHIQMAQLNKVREDFLTLLESNYK